MADDKHRGRRPNNPLEALDYQVRYALDARRLMYSEFGGVESADLLPRVGVGYAGGDEPPIQEPRRLTHFAFPAMVSGGHHDAVQFECLAKPIDDA